MLRDIVAGGLEFVRSLAGGGKSNGELQLGGNRHYELGTMLIRNITHFNGFVNPFSEFRVICYVSSAIVR